VYLNVSGFFVMLFNRSTGSGCLYIPQRDKCLVALAEIEAGHPKTISHQIELLGYEIRTLSVQLTISKHCQETFTAEKAENSMLCATHG
jgi:hypothetical protein